MDDMTAQRHLIVMRHAKAGELPGGQDACRELRPRGRRDAAAAGRWLAAGGLIPGLVFCSTATRAVQTWQYVSAELGAEPEVRCDPRLYQADARGVLDVIAEGPPGTRTLMYVGHNPAAADLTEILTGRPADMPTAAIAIIGTDVGWPGLAVRDADGAGGLVACWTPRAGS